MSHQPKQNQADDGTAQIKVNPTQLSEQMDHPVQESNYWALHRPGGEILEEAMQCANVLPARLSTLSFLRGAMLSAGILVRLLCVRCSSHSALSSP